MSGIVSALLRMVRTPSRDALNATLGRQPRFVPEETMVLVSDTDDSDVDRSLALTSDDEHSFVASSQLNTDTMGNDNSNIFVPPPSPFADSKPIPTITTDRDDTNLFIPGKVDMQLFRGPKNPLSAFYHHPLYWQNKTYISAEQAFQHAKFKHHKLSKIAHEELLRCRNSHDVKRTSNKWLPVCNSSWNTIRFEIMEEICTAKLHQCKSFANALRQSHSKMLIHNTETDDIWGCGVDFRGENMMGRILMVIRRKDAEYHREFPPLSAVKPSITTFEQNPITHSSPKKYNTLVIGNSNARCISKEISDRGLNSIGFVYPGQTIKQIADRIDSVNVHVANDQLDAILVHAGDIEIRSPSTTISEVSTDMETTITQLQSKFPKARIAISSIPYGRNAELYARISELNKKFQQLCRTSSNTVYICNRNAKLQRDNIHMTPQSKDFIARTFTHHVKQCL